MRRGWTPVAALAVLALACRPDAPAVTLRWSGAPLVPAGEGRWPARAEWCASARRLYLAAVRVDSSVALLVLPGGALAPGRYGVTPDTLASGPGARVALRLYDVAQQRIAGWRAIDGHVTLTATGERLDGRFEATVLHVADSAVRMRLSGRFTGVPRGDGGPGCPAAAGGETARPRVP